ncbi:hypothetical protein I79_019301 [Cricetulus griseus]|uniref:Uncharacterized protein n=1 Tax=Cricetulus griseus TaxID=10029 RepID=G3I720_CRIGR|nr:hypothetical protein I79_019301 [Cricetulus griseus]
MVSWGQAMECRAGLWWLVHNSSTQETKTRSYQFKEGHSGLEWETQQKLTHFGKATGALRICALQFTGLASIPRQGLM